MLGRNSDGDRNSWAGLGTFAFQLLLAVFVELVLDLAIWLQPLIILAALAVAAVVATVWSNPLGKPGPKNFLRALVNLQLGALRWLARAAPGVVVAVLIVFGLPPLLSLGEPCDFSTELRVVTGPENVTALRAAADRYVADRSGDGCQNVTVTVTEHSSITGLRLGFANGWLKPGANSGGPGSSGPSGAALQGAAFLGPRPDIWIPDTEFAFNHVRGYVEDQSGPSPSVTSAKAGLHLDGTVGSSPMVVGVFTDYDRAGPSQSTLSTLLSRLRSEQRLEALVRPSPDTSEAALLSTPILYQALQQGDDPWVGSDGEAERLLNTRGRITGDAAALQTGDAAALLCRFRTAGARGEQPPPGVAVIVPEKVLAAYNHGDDLGDDPGTACPSGQPPRQWRLSPHHTSDLPVLDHPFVQVRWPGEYTARRQSAIDDFRDWLGADFLTRFGFRTGSGEIAPPNGTNPLLQELTAGGDGSMPRTVEPRSPAGRVGCVKSLQEALDCYVAARPAASLTLLVDVSGSMVQLAGPEGERSVLRAQKVAEGIVSGAHTRDQIRVRTFSTETPPRSGPHTTISGDVERAALQAQIQQLAMAGSDMPLTEAIGNATRELRAGTQSLVVLTDGQSSKSNPGVADEAPALAAQLRERNSALRIFIVLIGPRKCAEQPIKPLADELGRGSCVDGSEIPSADIADSVISTILWGDRGPR